jgi:crotonobetainyl-CoA:carnitine CoA-transferase CaiB-like acyl-CoA transferase
VKTTLFPITMDGARLGVRMDPPRLGENTTGLLQGLGYSLSDIQALRDSLAVA